VGRAHRDGRRPQAGAVRLSDILAGQPSDAELLAEIYDLEHDAIVEDLAFYREWARRSPGGVIDLGCGSGRLFEALFAGGATRIVGIDGSAPLLARAAARIDAHASLRDARARGRIELVQGDVRRIRRPDHFALAILAGVLSHLDGPEDALRALGSAARLLTPDGTLVVDVLGPGGLPPHDLPLSLDWERASGGRRVVRRSRLERRETPEGLRVAYATLTDVVGADGTIARLPASFRLWYPSAAAVVALVAEAGLAVVAVYGSHDLEPLDGDSERCIVVARPMAGNPGDPGTG
jgi:SAM-dependent methyltransferase